MQANTHTHILLCYYGLVLLISWLGLSLKTFLAGETDSGPLVFTVQSWRPQFAKTGHGDRKLWNKNWEQSGRDEDSQILMACWSANQVKTMSSLRDQFSNNKEEHEDNKTWHDPLPSTGRHRPTQANTLEHGHIYLSHTSTHSSTHTHKW